MICRSNRLFIFGLKFRSHLKFRVKSWRGASEAANQPPAICRATLCIHRSRCSIHHRLRSVGRAPRTARSATAFLMRAVQQKHLAMLLCRGSPSPHSLTSTKNHHVMGRRAAGKRPPRQWSRPTGVWQGEPLLKTEEQPPTACFASGLRRKA